MSSKKRPDNVVYNEEKQKYDASLKSYATNLGAPVITSTDTLAWKNKSILRVNKNIQARYLEIKNEYDKMMKQFEYNQLIFNAQFNFEPIVGEMYHLYKRINGDSFLSIIPPNECSFNLMGSFYLNTDLIWEKCKE